MPKMNRRKFVAGAAAGFMGLSLGAKASSPSTEEEELKIKKYNPLGKTGIKASDIICGTSKFFSSSVIKYAYDLGVNLFDTAENYMNGRSEEMIGKALKGVRHKIYITSKYLFPADVSKITKKSIYDRVDASLKRLQTDYLDMGFIHGIRNLELLKNETITGAFKDLVKQGKIRFTGFSTHDAAATLKECLKPEFADFVQVVLFFYNHMEGKQIEPLIAKVRARGIGTIVMKSSAGGKQGNIKKFVNKKQSYVQAAAKWVLANPDVDCCVVSMADFTQVEEFAGISGTRLRRDDLALLDFYRKAVDKTYCRLSCNKCESSCPQAVAISDVMRYAMYYEDYGHQLKAIEHYAALDNRKKPIACTECAGYCSSACPFSLEVKDKLLHTHKMLT
jgi:predicted aldo/keto reductase-like oxidoreductase